jgi:hypothetical protein
MPLALGRYLRLRDPCLVSILACMALYMVSTGNHQRWVDPEFATHPMFQVGGWVGGWAGGRPGPRPSGGGVAAAAAGAACFPSAQREAGLDQAVGSSAAAYLAHFAMSSSRPAPPPVHLHAGRLLLDCIQPLLFPAPHSLSPLLSRPPVCGPGPRAECLLLAALWGPHGQLPGHWCLQNLGAGAGAPCSCVLSGGAHATPVLAGEGRHCGGSAGRRQGGLAATAPASVVAVALVCVAQLFLYFSLSLHIRPLSMPFSKL